MLFWLTATKVLTSSKFWFSHLILYFMQLTSAKKKFSNWIKSNFFFYGVLKTWKSFFLAAYPCRWSHDRHAQSCDVDSGTCDFRLDLPYHFSFLVHAKCSFPAFCMNYLKFKEVKQARWVKPEVTCSLIYVITVSKPREDWCEWWTKMAANLNVTKLL